MPFGRPGARCWSPVSGTALQPPQPAPCQHPGCSHIRGPPSPRCPVHVASVHARRSHRSSLRSTHEERRLCETAPRDIQGTPTNAFRKAPAARAPRQATSPFVQQSEARLLKLECRQIVPSLHSLEYVKTGRVATSVKPAHASASWTLSFSSFPAMPNNSPCMSGLARRCTPLP